MDILILILPTAIFCFSIYKSCARLPKNATISGVKAITSAVSVMLSAFIMINVIKYTDGPITDTVPAILCSVALFSWGLYCRHAAPSNLPVRTKTVRAVLYALITVAYIALGAFAPYEGHDTHRLIYASLADTVLIGLLYIAARKFTLRASLTSN